MIVLNFHRCSIRLMDIPSGFWKEVANVLEHDQMLHYRSLFIHFSNRWILIGAWMGTYFHLKLWRNQVPILGWCYNLRKSKVTNWTEWNVGRKSFDDVYNHYLGTWKKTTLTFSKCSISYIKRRICLRHAMILKLFGEDHHNDKRNFSCKFHQNPSWGRSFSPVVVPFLRQNFKKYLPQLGEVAVARLCNIHFIR